MPRRIHDPDRGGSLLEYSAVVVLCAAILGALLGAGALGRLGTGVQSAVQGVFTPAVPEGDDPGDDSSDTSDTGSEPGIENSGFYGREDFDRPASGGDGTGGASDEEARESESEGDGGFWDGLRSRGGDARDRIEDTGGGVWDGFKEAGGNTRADMEQSYSSLHSTYGDLRDDPGQATRDRAESGWERTTGFAEALREDPAGTARDFALSDAGQERCREGDWAGCSGMFIGENATAAIPGFGWQRKSQRAAQIADGSDRNDRGGSGGESDGQREEEEGEEPGSEPGEPSPQATASPENEPPRPRPDGGEAEDGGDIHEYLEGLETRPPPDPPYEEEMEYQLEHAGEIEYKIEGGGESVRADGVDVEERAAVEVKHVGDTDRSPYLESYDTPHFIEDEIDDQFRRYAAVINDEDTPLEEIKVITNDEGAESYLNGFRKKYDIEGEVLVKP